MKKCTKCKKKKPLNEFYRSKNTTDGYRCWCTECEKKWRQDNREKMRKYSLKYYHKNKEKINKKKREYKKIAMNHYGGKCACCGEKQIEFLTLDHIDNDGNEHRRKLGNKGINMYSHLIKINFQTKYRLQVLCMNCNWAKEKCGKCPHSLKE